MAWGGKFLGMGAFAAAFIGAQFLVKTINRVSSEPNPDETISGATRAAMVDEAIKTCNGTQKANPENRGISTSVIEAYCACYAAELAGWTTYGDLLELKNNAAGMTAVIGTDKWQARINIAAKACYPK